MKNSLSVIILTWNEELNLEKCLKSVAGIADEIFVVDSYSTDKTLEIAESYGAKIYKHPFKNQAEQFNWALDNLPLEGDWILRIDADEVLIDELAKEIMEVIRTAPPEISGFYLRRRVYFMGRWIRHGGYYPTWMLRLFRTGKGREEIREMDEHIILSEGRAGYLQNDFIDDDRKGLERWIVKHNNFSTREARERLREARLADSRQLEAKIGGGQASRKRWMKNKLYMKLPPFFRALFYYLYRYIFRLGFLDGKEGLIFHFLQGFWHQFMIDAKMYEQKTTDQAKSYVNAKFKRGHQKILG